ncbi:MAG: hypothetical protein GX621_18735 [Pirellulaceae bacterium]|nr:hypothetical protein [Pirellulaceae bacterium]
MSRRTKTLTRILHEPMTWNPVCHCLPLRRPLLEYARHCLRPAPTANLAGKQCGLQVQA